MKVIKIIISSRYNKMKSTMIKLLNERINRILFQNELIKKHKLPLISVQTIYPGANKENNVTINIIGILDDLLCDMFQNNIYKKIFINTAEGPILIILVEKDVLKVKKTVMEIEDKHTLRYCINIDVYDTNCNIINRTDLGYKPKKYCNISDFNKCNEKNKKFSDDEIRKIVRESYFKYKISMN